ncbi:MAG: FoF1 ATP synthase subunit a [Chloroflexota bacterium]
MKKRRLPNRWIFLFIIILSVLAASAFPPIRPHVQLPAERLTHDPLFTLPVIGDFYFTNTMLAVLLADIILLLSAWFIRKQIKSGKSVLSGIPGVFGALLEMLFGMTETTTPKWAKKIFPYFATIMLIVLIVNWMELIPGVDSIGYLEHSEHGFPTQEIAPGIVTIVKADNEHTEPEEHTADKFMLVPYVRVASTDLNFTVGLALVSVFMIQVMGIRALGGGYLKKFINIDAIRAARLTIKKPGFGNPLELIMPFVNFAVGLLEIVAEISKVLSFSFRLFGNIFAGSVLLFVIGSLVPVFAQSFFLVLELGIGLIQAFVFGILTMVFMSMATQAHGEHEEAHV